LWMRQSLKCHHHERAPRCSRVNKRGNGRKDKAAIAFVESHELPSLNQVVDVQPQPVREDWRHDQVIRAGTGRNIALSDTSKRVPLGIVESFKRVNQPGVNRISWSEILRWDVRMIWQHGIGR